LLGGFILIPLVGIYNAFVLGFMGQTVLASATRAALLGFVVFAATGLLSGWIISHFRPKSAWLPAFLSLLITGILLVSASLIRYTYLGVPGIQSVLPLPATTGRADADELSMALKVEYHNAGEVPLYITGTGSFIPLLQLQPSLQVLSKGFALQDGPYVYCNLPPEVWKGLKKSASAQKYPLLWATQADATGKRLVISVDLKTDVFSDELVTEQTFAQMLTDLESTVRQQTSGATFSLPE
jgi:hypothetical protein